jgi:hypothetical protein
MKSCNALLRILLVHICALNSQTCIVAPATDFSNFKLWLPPPRIGSPVQFSRSYSSVSEITCSNININFFIIYLGSVAKRDSLSKPSSTTTASTNVTDVLSESQSFKSTSALGSSIIAESSKETDVRVQLFLFVGCENSWIFYEAKRGPRAKMFGKHSFKK